MSERIRKSLFGAGWLSLCSLLLNALSVPVMAYIIRSLGPTGYGHWATGAALVAAIGAFSSLGLRSTFVRSVARDRRLGPVAMAEQVGMRLILSTGAAVLAVLACLALRYPWPVVQCVAIGAVGVVLMAVATTLTDLFQAYEELSTVATVNFTSGLLLTAASIVAAWSGRGPAIVALAYLMGPMSAIVCMMMIAQRRHFPLRVRWSLRTLFERLKESRFIAAQQMIAAANNHASGLMLPNLIGATGFGFFSAGTIIASRMEVIPDSLAAAMYPAVAHAAPAGPARTRRLVLQWLVIAVLVSLPIAAGAAVLAGPIARLLFPGKAEVCYQVMRITVWALPLSSMVYITGFALNAAGRDAAQMRISFLSSVVSIAVTIALILCLGITGACWAFVLRPAISLCFLSREFALTFFSNRHLAMDAPIRPVSETAVPA